MVHFKAFPNASSLLPALFPCINPSDRHEKSNKTSMKK